VSGAIDFSGGRGGGGGWWRSCLYLYYLMRRLRAAGGRRYSVPVRCLGGRPLRESTRCPRDQPTPPAPLTSPPLTPGLPGSPSRFVLSTARTSRMWHDYVIFTVAAWLALPHSVGPSGSGKTTRFSSHRGVLRRRLRRVLPTVSLHQVPLAELRAIDLLRRADAAGRRAPCATTSCSAARADREDELRQFAGDHRLDTMSVPAALGAGHAPWAPVGIICPGGERQRISTPRPAAASPDCGCSTRSLPS